MTFVCSVCKDEPRAHSFKKIGEKDNVNYFYTCPAKALKYNDTEGILIHYRGTLNDYKDQKWVWIFDSKKFSAKHAINIPLAVELAKLIKSYSSTLVKIEIINATWHIRSLLKIITPFLDEKTKGVIQINDNIQN